MNQFEGEREKSMRDHFIVKSFKYTLSSPSHASIPLHESKYPRWPIIKSTPKPI